MEYLHPGVYVEEIPTGVRSIEGVQTSTAGLIGVTEFGPTDRVTRIKNFAEFQQNYGGFRKDSWLAHSALQFFDNGGKDLYVARVVPQRSGPPDEDDYKRGFALLDNAKDISIVAVPGVGTPSIVAFGADYCERRQDCFFIGEMAQEDQTTDHALAFIGALSSKNTYGALYFPWIKINDPLGESEQPLLVPPSGAIAGIYARVDYSRGVWTSPAGEQAIIKGAVGLAANISDGEQDALNPARVNTIRSFPSHSSVVWGARTMGSATNPEYRYVAVRRTAIFLGQSIQRGTRWAVHEPNDENLWQALRQSVADFMLPLWRAGAFQGSKPEHAFFVKVDRDTLSQNDVDAGIVNIVIGFAPLKPAEFVNIKIGQWTRDARPSQRAQVRRRGCAARTVTLPLLLPSLLVTTALNKLKDSL